MDLAGAHGGHWEADGSSGDHVLLAETDQLGAAEHSLLLAAIGGAEGLRDGDEEAVKGVDEPLLVREAVRREVHQVEGCVWREARSCDRSGFGVGKDKVEEEPEQSGCHGVVGSLSRGVGG